MKRGKRGQGLPLNTIVLAILVVVVLVVIVAFFLGGTTGLTRTIRGIFFGTTAGTDLTIAIETCKARCDQATLLPMDLQKSSAFCMQPFHIDKDGNGEAEFNTVGGKKVYDEFYCGDYALAKFGGDVELLSVPCEFSCQ